VSRETAGLLGVPLAVSVPIFDNDIRTWRGDEPAGRHELLTGVRRPAGDETGIEWRGAAGGEVGFVLVHTSPRMSWTRGLSSTPDCATGRSPAPEHVS